MNQEMLENLKALSKAKKTFDEHRWPQRESKGFDVKNFMDLPRKEQGNVLVGIYALVFGRGELERDLVEGGYLDADFRKRFDPVYTAYLNELGDFLNS